MDKVKSNEEIEKELESDLAEEDNDEDGDGGKADNVENYQGSGRTVTLQMLLAAKMLEPGKSTMTIEYLGQKFVGDLLADGKIKSQETETIFCSPSAWAMHCKRIINPDKKSGCGWASVKYKGKKLDAYKAQWLRKCQLHKEYSPSEDEAEIDSEKKETRVASPIKRDILPHNTINNRNISHDANTLVEAVSFSSINKIQPFLISITTSSVLLMDFHCHLSKHEVSGYLGGTWDVNSHTLYITHAFPCRNSKYDRTNAHRIELEIQKMMVKQNLIPVGWYHSHPKFSVQPTLRDCDTQLDYQIKMRGSSEATYSPCIGLICSPYCVDNHSLESSIICYWVIPPPENKVVEYGRPMLMTYSVKQDDELSADILNEIKTCVEYYKQYPDDIINFKENFNIEWSYIEKLKVTMYSKFPRKQDDHQFWNWIRQLLNLDAEPEFIAPKWATKILLDESKNIKEDLSNIPVSISSVNQIIQKLDPMKSNKDDKLLIRSLQEQLNLPSGLNMNPSPISSSLLLPNMSSSNLSSNNSVQTSSSSPRDSPITIPSNSASPAKFEIPVRASPSPAKSDTSSTKTRNSPAPSPNKFAANDLTRSSPNIMPHKYETSTAASPMTNTSNLNDFYAANFSSLAKNFTGFAPSDYAMLFQSKDYTLSHLNQLAAASMVSGNNKQASSSNLQTLSPSTMSGNMKDFIAQLEKSSELNYLMQTHYNYPNMTMTPAKSNNDLPSKSNNKQEKSKNNSSSARAIAQQQQQQQQRILEEEYKKDANKINEFMRSQEYASLLEQAEALNNSGYTFPELTSLTSANPTSSKKSSKRSQHSSASMQSTNDLTSLLQASPKIHELNSLFQASKQNELTSLLQQHISASSQTKKHQSRETQAADLNSLFPHSKLSELTSMMSNQQSHGAIHHGQHISDLSAFFGSSLTGSKASSDAAALSASVDMLGSLLQSGKNQDISSLLFSQANAVELSNLFTQSTNIPKTSSSTSTYYSQALDKAQQDMAALYQNSKFSTIPDPLSKSTLAANNMFMNPAVYAKLQQEALNAMIMRPPKVSSASSITSTSSKSRETSAASPVLEKTFKNSSRECSSNSSSMKYNFSAVDLAVSSIPNATSASISTDILRKSNSLSPMDSNSSGISIPEQSHHESSRLKKRMEFSSIADLAAPPSKTQKLDDLVNLHHSMQNTLKDLDTSALNLSSTNE